MPKTPYAHVCAAIVDIIDRRTEQMMTTERVGVTPHQWRAILVQHDLPPETELVKMFDVIIYPDRGA